MSCAITSDAGSRCWGTTDAMSHICPYVLSRCWPKTQRNCAKQFVVTLPSFSKLALTKDALLSTTSSAVPWWFRTAPRIPIASRVNARCDPKHNSPTRLYSCGGNKGLRCVFWFQRFLLGLFVRFEQPVGGYNQIHESVRSRLSNPLLRIRHTGLPRREVWSPERGVCTGRLQPLPPSSHISISRRMKMGWILVLANWSSTSNYATWLRFVARSDLRRQLDYFQVRFSNSIGHKENIGNGRMLSTTPNNKIGVGSRRGHCDSTFQKNTFATPFVKISGDSEQNLETYVRTMHGVPALRCSTHTN